MDSVRAGAALPSLLHDPAVCCAAVVPKWSIDAESLPASGFSGDFWMTSECGDALWFAAGDFAGHGLQAAVPMAMLQEEIECLTHEDPDALVESIVTEVDRALKSFLPSNRFATLVLGRATNDGEIEIVNAGHCYPVVLRADGSLEWIPSHGPVVGISPFAEWRCERISLDQGDRLIIYSDGVVEAEDAAGEELGSERLAEFLARAPRAELIETVLREVKRFTGGVRRDDATLFVLARE
ncbi:MAG: PP2C family protein-serine/threonine phosphatase [Thermoanaerobaculia bacterium]